MAYLNSVNILGVNVSCIDLTTLLDMVGRWCEHSEVSERVRKMTPIVPKTITYVNANCLNIACEDAEYRQLLNQADLVYSDGISVVWSSYLLGGCRIQKITGADWIFDFCKMALENDLSFFIIAGKPGIALQAARKLREKWPGLKIVGACDGYFVEKSEAEVLHDIKQAKPQVIFVGMGAPHQEKWIAAIRDEIPASVCWSVGALFDFVAGVEPRVPTWMNALALEWLWRLLIDPGGKWRRYLVGNPLFVFRVINEKYWS